MSNQLVSQFSQVFIHYFSNKSRSTTKVFVSEPSKNLEQKLGRLFGIIEINTPSRENSRIINQLIADLEHIYYSIEADTAEAAFENTLKIVNDDFIKMISENSTSMVGNLNEYTIREKINFVIGVVQDSSLYLTTLNAIGTFLMHRTNQGYKLVEIVPFEQKEWSKELKLFDTIVSGTINPHDYLLFCNNDFLNFVSKERILKTVTSLPPHKAADYFKNALLHHDGFNFAAVIVKSTPPLSAEQAIPQSLASIDVLNRQESKTEKILSPSFLPNLSGIFNKFKKQDRPAAKTPAAQESGTPDLSTLKKSTLAELIDKLPVSKNTDGQAPASSPISRSLSEAQAKAGKAMSSMKSSVSQLSSKINLNSTFQNVRTYFRLKWNQARQKLQAIPGLSRILIAIVVICAGLFAYSVIFLKGGVLPALTTNKANESLTAIETTLTEAQSKLIIGDKAETKRLLAQAEAQIAAVKVSSSKDQEYLTRLSQTFDQLISKLRNISTLTELSTLYSSPAGTGAITSILKADATLYVIDNSQKSIFSIDTTTRQSQTIPLGETSIIKAKLINDKPLLLSASNTFIALNNGALKNVSIPLQPGENVADYAYYNDHLYNLIPSANQIYRHQPAGDGYSAGITWIQESGIVIDKAVSLNIDNAIWVATSDGQIMKFFKGFKQAFTVGEIDPPLTNITSMIKRLDDKYIYLLDGSTNRIIVLDQTGALITQYYIPAMGNITAFDVDEKGQALYLANSNSVSAALIHLP